MIKYYLNPYDSVCQQHLQDLNNSGVYPTVVSYASSTDAPGVWVSFLPSMVLFDETDGSELSRLEDFGSCTASNFQYMQGAVSDIKNAKQTKATLPAARIRGVKIKGVDY